MLNFASKIGTSYNLQALHHENDVSVDLYINKKPNINACIYFLYGGRWTKGKKENFRFVAHKFLKAGYHIAIADYRKHPQVKFPAFVGDAACGFIEVDRYFKENYSARMPLYVMGHSSGAHIGAVLSADSKYLSKHENSKNLISGFIGISGPYKFIDYISTSKDLPIIFGPVESYPDSQPILLAEKAENLPPMLLIHGDKDNHVLPLNTEKLAEVANKKTVAEVFIVPNFNHVRTIAAFGLPFWPKRTNKIITKINDFIKKINR